MTTLIRNYSALQAVCATSIQEGWHQGKSRQGSKERLTLESVRWESKEPLPDVSEHCWGSCKESDRQGKKVTWPWLGRGAKALRPLFSPKLAEVAGFWAPVSMSCCTLARADMSAASGGCTWGLTHSAFTFSVIASQKIVPSNLQTWPISTKITARSEKTLHPLAECTLLNLLPALSCVALSMALFPALGGQFGDWPLQTIDTLVTETSALKTKWMKLASVTCYSFSIRSVLRNLATTCKYDATLHVYTEELARPLWACESASDIVCVLLHFLDCQT